jgi:hypothetical protein
MAGTITSANAVFVLTVPSLFPAPIQLQGFSAEKAWSTDNQDTTESLIGVDGQKASGWIPAMIKQSVSLQANSSSRSIFNAIARAQRANRDAIVFQGTITLPSTGESFSLLDGTLKDYKPIPDGAKVLQPIEFNIEWRDIQPTLI